MHETEAERYVRMLFAGPAERRGITHYTMTGRRDGRSPNVSGRGIEVDAAGRVWGGPFLTDRIDGHSPVEAILDEAFTTDTKEAPAMMDRSEIIKSELNRLQRELAALEAIPNLAELEDEATLSFERSFEGGSPFGTWYVFVAVKIGDSWHTTGRRSGERFSSAELRELLASDSVRNIFKSTGWEAVAKVVETEAEDAPAAE